MSFQFTPSQLQAIESRGGAVLVSAAAGSGKTRVLTERLLRRVADPEQPVDIDRFLVITYTRAAAAELRDRIMSALGARAAARPEDKRLRRQQTLCCRAHIGTIHSFCTELIREHCHRLGIPPAFTVLDEERAGTMKGAALARLLDRRYERIERDGAFRLLTDTVGAGRDDRRLERTILSLYDKLRSQPWPADWAAAQKAALALEGVGDVAETVWGKELLNAARDEAEEHISAMERALREITEAGGAIQTAYGPSFDATAAGLRDFRRALDAGWDRARVFADIPFPRLGGLRNFGDADLKGRVTAARDACKKAAEGFKETFDRDSNTLLNELRDTAPAMGALLDLALELDAAFSAEKLRRGYLDFSDLEHYAARLLVDKDSGLPTWIAAETASRFVEVMVDEYQDVSPIQDLIFRAVSRDETNLFLVGDVKQSIYRFRLADPSLFLAKYHSYRTPEDAGESEPRRILLQENFRSRKAILDAANTVFSNIMSEKLGELDYDADAALKYGAFGYPEGSDVPVEFDVIDDAGGETEVPPEKSELEARFVANKILAMMNAGTLVHGSDGPRKCEWDDFVLLLRSPGARGAVFHRVLSERGIPVQSQYLGGFFTSLEVTVAVNLLSLVDNPHADVPLISVLRSPAFGFSPDELSAIRAGSRDTDFYTALRAAAASGDGRCAAFLETLDAWRAAAPDLELDALLRRVCGDADLFAICAAMSDGETRRKNLTRLFEYARAFSESGYRGVFRFVSWLRRLAEKGAEPAFSSAGENAVKLMSIHKSKGLEFPFVFLCDLNHPFNRSDARESVLLHSELGLGPKYTDAARGIEYPTVARRAIERRLSTETLSEEMRVLYVGMTRARERLFLTCARRNAAEALEKLRPGLTRPVSPAALRAAPHPARWLALAALADEGCIQINVAGRAGDGETPAAEAAAAEAADGAAYRRLTEALGFSYPHAASADLPSRLTATELKRAAEAAETAEAESLAPREKRFAFRRAELGKTRELTAAEKGTAAHAFLQYLDFSKTDTAEQLRAEAERIAAAGRLSPEEREAVDFDTILKLFASPLGRAMRDAGARGELRREFRFTLLADASEYFDGADAADKLLLQGVVDCFFVENGGVTVLDYKTDRVGAAGAAGRAEAYRGQLATYAKALERILRLPVRRCVLWFLQPGVEIDVKL